jgi:polycomb group RING finger protein 4
VENQVPENRIEVVTTEYKGRFSTLRQRLSATSFHFPHIVDVQWRCDFLMKTNEQERLNTPTFFVKLKVINEKGQLQDVQFTCSHDQLQDLVGRLQDATASLDRLDMYQTEQ